MYLFGVILSIAFLLSGSMKLFRALTVRKQFEEFGLPEPIMMLVGLAELAGAVGLQAEPIALFTALALIVLMVAAIAYHVKAKHTPLKTLPPVLTFIALCIYVGMSL